MAQETWLVVAVAAGFLLMGIAASPLGWVALLHRRTRGERERERSFGELQTHLRRPAGAAGAVRGGRVRSPRAGRGDGAAGRALASFIGCACEIGEGAEGRVGGAMLDDPAGPRLIAVPNLATAHDRPAMHNGLSQRYAAIWDLADNGSSPDVIARATGQPIGQIELILGLRRQVDASRTNIPHASHE